MHVATRMEIRDLRSLDWPEVAAIYEDGIRTGNATFETSPPGREAFEAAHSVTIVAELGGSVAGWASLAPVSSRCCYRGVAEDSVYVAGWARGRGVGRALLEEQCRRADAAGLWTIQAATFAENAASVALHERCGFRVVGVRERIAQKRGVWRDTVLLERRSSSAG